MTEREAVDMLRTGRAEGLEFLVAEHELMALRLAYTILGDRASADEAVAEAFLKVYRHIDRFEAGRPFRPWFLKIVSNEALGMARRARRAGRPGGPPRRPAGAPPPPGAPGQHHTGRGGGGGPGR